METPHRFRLSLLIIFSMLLIQLLAPQTGMTACQVSLRWDPSVESNVRGYRLFLRQAEESYPYHRPVWEGGETRCTIGQLEEDTVYFFVVRAFDAQGNESGDSNEIQFMMDSSQPARPQLLKPAQEAQGVSLTPLLQTSAFSDPNPQDKHARSRWQVFRAADDQCALDIDTSGFLTQFTPPPLILDENTTYYWIAQHIDTNGSSSQPSQAFFTTGVWEADGNANGIPDVQEAAPGPLGSTADLNLKWLKSASGGGTIGIGLDMSADCLLDSAQTISSGSLQTESTVRATLPMGLIGFKLQLARPGDTAQVSIVLPSAPSPNQTWIGFAPSGYEDLKTQASWSEDRKSVSLRVIDGGIGDVDGTANGSIVGIGGYGTLTGGSTSPGGEVSTGGGGGGGGGGGCFISSLLGL